MNLKEKLEAKEAELKALAPKIEEGDEECIKSSEALAEEIKGIRELIEKAEKAKEAGQSADTPSSEQPTETDKPKEA